MEGSSSRNWKIPTVGGSCPFFPELGFRYTPLPYPQCDLVQQRMSKWPIRGAPDISFGYALSSPRA